MVQQVCVWGFNPGQAYVKNSMTGTDGQRRDLTPFPAVIAPMAHTDSLGMTTRQNLKATINGREYIGGTLAARLPLAQRQQADGRLDADSPMYAALVQMSWSIMQQPPNMPVALATALPASWRQHEGADERMKAHLINGLAGLADVRDIWVQSEPGAVIYHELLTDQGTLRTDQRALAAGLVLVGDIGGSTLNRAVVEKLETLPGQSASPYLGSRQPIDMLAQQRGIQIPDAEAMLRAELAQPGSDDQAGRILTQYREAVLAELQTAWTGFAPVAYLFAGGTVSWFMVERRKKTVNLLCETFGSRARVLENTQQVIATGLYRYAAMKVYRGQKHTGQTSQPAAKPVRKRA